MDNCNPAAAMSRDGETASYDVGESRRITRRHRMQFDSNRFIRWVQQCHNFHWYISPFLPLRSSCNYSLVGTVKVTDSNFSRQFISLWVDWYCDGLMRTSASRCTVNGASCWNFSSKPSNSALRISKLCSTSPRNPLSEKYDLRTWQIRLTMF